LNTLKDPSRFRVSTLAEALPGDYSGNVPNVLIEQRKILQWTPVGHSAISAAERVNEADHIERPMRGMAGRMDGDGAHGVGPGVTRELTAVEA
jgi:hypothetical protein